MNKSVLIVKTSSLGDIIQSFSVLQYIHEKLSGVRIDWVVEEAFAKMVAAHPLIHKAIAMDLRGFKKTGNFRKLLEEIRCLRNVSYDFVFDLQKNTKSGFITALARSPMKVGFGWRSVREWPNVLATHRRFEIPMGETMQRQYLELVCKFFGDEDFEEKGTGVALKISDSEQDRVTNILRAPELIGSVKIMVCPGSRWRNKQLPLETMMMFLAKIDQALDASFVFVGGDPEGMDYCQQMRSQFVRNSVAVENLEIATWQNLMQKMELVIAVDSAALHLCGTTNTPSFSLFGPTSPEVFKPMGHKHFAMQGSCPYGRTFIKQCPVLRSCPTGLCIRSLDADAVFLAFWGWWEAKIVSIH
ncbi:MAG TPA: glycosyltransferase family 9 protein [Chlamydiales bacterium]|nr:glycosyltransferase family 9 protein [Chlamydiales bacterium]